jgi:putative tryptophan/tyrosine transport system substrate-binding protein
MREFLRKMGIRPCFPQFAVFIMIVASPSAIAQEAMKIWKVGVLWHAADPQGEGPMYQAFTEGMRDLGYVEGRNIKYYHTFVDEKYDRFPANAQQLVEQKVDVIMASVANAAAAAAKLTNTIPIVFAASGEPVRAGLVESMNHPGGNVTGFSLFYPELAIKHLEMLQDIVHLARVAVLWNPSNQDHASMVKGVEQAAKQTNIELIAVSAKGPDEFGRAFGEIGKTKADGAIVLGDAMFRVNAPSISALAVNSRLPAIYAARDFVDAGGLISYGACIPCNFRRAATYVDKILKGARAADLPVQQPTTFQLVVNLKAAQALGLTIPATILTSAQEVIE